VLLPLIMFMKNKNNASEKNIESIKEKKAK
jgi:hypothetical protein